jgi:hypothetical protein
MPDNYEEPNQPVPSASDAAQNHSAELTDDDKSLLAAFQEDMRAEEELINRYFGNEKQSLKKETSSLPENPKP